MIDVREGPLKGITIVDLSQWLAGPIATRIMADLGATVIKVEAPARPDPIRLSGQGAAVRAAISDDHNLEGFNSGPVFNLANRGKLSLGLDYRTALGRQFVLELLKSADVFVENFAAGVADRYGFGWQDVRSANSRIVMLSMPLYGSSGPRAEWVGFGQHTEALSGIAAQTGYVNEGPRVQGGLAYGDPVAGLYGAFATVATLQRARADGQGRHIDLSHVEALALHLGEQLDVSFALQDDGFRVSASGQISNWLDVVRCSGEDSWCTIAWPTGRPQSFPMRDSHVKRHETHGTHNSSLSVSEIPEIAAGLDSTILARSLEQVGIPAGPARSVADLATDVDLLARGMVVEVDHPVVGPKLYTGFPGMFDGEPIAFHQAGPLFGQHNQEVVDMHPNPPLAQEVQSSGLLSETPQLHDKGLV